MCGRTTCCHLVCYERDGEGGRGWEGEGEGKGREGERGREGAETEYKIHPPVSAVRLRILEMLDLRNSK